ncbi:MAG: type II secretion system protein [Firmicutes bacterium]|nr:type II secretion system protein [Bacillota bacterium]
MEKLNKLGYTKVELLIVIALLGIVAFIAINKTSYAFSINNSSAIQEVINLIEKQAEEYALDNKDIFNDSDTTYISVEDLINNKYLIPNEKGLIISPENPDKSYNKNKIKLEYKNNKVIASFIL